MRRRFSRQCGRIERAMLAPIITKDMKLFPSRPLPSNIKNVRSRAQSLDQVSALQSSSAVHGRIVPVRPRNSQSTGNLPTLARSPPGSTRKSTLAAIQEGVEMCDRKDESTTSSPTLDLSVKNSISAVPVKKMTPSQAAKIDAVKKSKLSTGSSSDSASDDGGERKENKKGKKRSVVKWIASAFRKECRSEVGEVISPENVSTISS